jgi:hypothetical protein
MVDTMRPAVSESEASRFNQMIMRKLQKALDADPEVDLASKIPSSYSSRLALRKAKGLRASHPRYGNLSSSQDMKSDIS